LPEAFEPADVRRQYSTVRLHAGIGYVNRNDEYQGRGLRVCAARKRGLRQGPMGQHDFRRTEKLEASSWERRR
jgi:putative transposase